MLLINWAARASLFSNLMCAVNTFIVHMVVKLILSMRYSRGKCATVLTVIICRGTMCTRGNFWGE